MEFGLDYTAPATPSLPLPPTPPGHSTYCAEPTLVFQVGLTFER